ncbi:MAG: cell wall-binding repeat-containing protein [Coriobacteriales bacterium]
MFEDHGFKIFGRKPSRVSAKAVTSVFFSVVLTMGMWPGSVLAETTDGGDGAEEASIGYSTEDTETSWDISEASDGSVTASVTSNGDGTYTLSIEGTGQMADYTSGTEVPWYADYGDVVTTVTIGDGVTNVGEYALGQAALEKVTGGSTLSVIDDHAFDGAANLVAIDLTGCTLTSVGANSFGSSADDISVERSIYVTDSTSANAVTEGFTSDARAKNALAVTNGGTYASDAVFESGALSSPTKEDYTFNRWTISEDLMWPTTSTWKPMYINNSSTVFYAKWYVTGTGTTEEGTTYNGSQGEDQTVTVLDLDALPSTLKPNPDVLYYGFDSEHYLNKFQTAFDGSERIVFAYNTGRGGNSNGGDGTYQVMQQMPHVSILDSEGNTVATYDNGSGDLKLFSIVFDGEDGKTTGGWISAFRIGVEADMLEAGTYTLRFDKYLGTNNGMSFLDRNVDFEFTVVNEADYELSYTQLSDGTYAVSGITANSTSAFNVEIPSTYNGVAVTAISDSAFSGQSLVKSITVPSSVTSIGDGAFANMESLEWVKVLSESSSSPSFGEGVFTGSASCLLYGYDVADTVEAAAGEYDNVEFRLLDDGIYIDGTAVTSGDTYEMTSDDTSASVQILSGGEDVTDDYIGYISNTNVVSHEAALADYWSDLTAVADGEVNLVIKDAVDYTELATIKLSVTGFGTEGSTDLVTSTSAQGNGCTIRIKGTMDDTLTVHNAAWDETVSYQNYIVEEIGAENATFKISIQGPGSAWSYERWDWDTWTSEHLNSYLNVYEADSSSSDGLGDLVASFDNGGLYWITNSNNSDNLVLGVSQGLLQPGNTYVLVASSELTGHNISAQLYAEVHWTFQVGQSDISEMGAQISEISSQDYTGSAVEPEFSLTVTTPECTLWNETTESEYVAQEAGVQTLTSGTDYTVSYSNNVDIYYDGVSSTDSVPTATATGTGNYKGTVSATFEIVRSDVDVDDLLSAISSANSAMEGVEVSEDGDGLDDGTEYASQEDFDTLNSAIDSAVSVLEDSASTQDSIDSATSTLNSATSAFESAIQTVNTEPSAWKRLSGKDRYATMAKILDEQWADGSAETMVLATGENFPDALAAGSLSGVLEAPLLITSGKTLSASTKAEIERLVSSEGSKVIIIGGEGAISSAVESEVDAIDGVSVERIYGKSRVQTAEKIYSYVADDDTNGTWGETAIVVSGDNYPDALSAASYGYAAKAPIFLAKDGEIDSTTATYIRDGGFDTVLIVGGNAAVNFSSVRSSIADPYVVYGVFSGKTRYETSQLFATWSCGGTVDGVIATCDVTLGYDNITVASGKNFPDALAAVSLAGPRKAPILLVSTESDSVTKSVVEGNSSDIEQGYIVGGAAAIPAETEESLNSYIGL